MHKHKPAEESSPFASPAAALASRSPLAGGSESGSRRTGRGPSSAREAERALAETERVYAAVVNTLLLLSLFHPVDAHDSGLQSVLRSIIPTGLQAHVAIEYTFHLLSADAAEMSSETWLFSTVGYCVKMAVAQSRANHLAGSYLWFWLRHQARTGGAQPAIMQGLLRNLSMRETGKLIRFNDESGQMVVILMMMLQFLLGTSLTSEEMLRDLALSLGPFYTWPGPYGAAARRALSAVEAELRSPGCHLRAALEADNRTLRGGGGAAVPTSLAPTRLLVDSGDEQARRLVLLLHTEPPGGGSVENDSDAGSDASADAARAPTHLVQLSLLYHTMERCGVSNKGLANLARVAVRLPPANVASIYRRFAEAADRAGAACDLGESKRILRAALEQARGELETLVDSSQGGADDGKASGGHRRHRRIKLPVLSPLPFAVEALSTTKWADVGFERLGMVGNSSHSGTVVSIHAQKVSRSPTRVGAGNVTPPPHVSNSHTAWLVGHVRMQLQIRDSQQQAGKNGGGGDKGGERQVVKIGVVGREAAVHYTLCAYVAAMEEEPALMGRADVRFYLIPTGKVDALSNFLMMYDNWYASNVVAPGTCVLPLVPYLQDERSDEPAPVSKKNTLVGSAPPAPPPANQRRRSTGLAGGAGGVPRAMHVTPSTLLTAQLDAYFREAEVVCDVRVFYCEVSWLHKGTPMWARIPFCSSVEIGARACVAEAASHGDFFGSSILGGLLGKNSGESDESRAVSSGPLAPRPFEPPTGTALDGALRRHAVTCSLTAWRVALDGEAERHPVTFPKANAFPAIALYNVPPRGDSDGATPRAELRGPQYDPRSGWLELHAVTEEVAAQRRRDLRDFSSVLAAADRHHVNAVAVQAPDVAHPFSAVIDGQLYGPFTELRVAQCAPHGSQAAFSVAHFTDIHP